jgi:hypothetical protein
LSMQNKKVLLYFAIFSVMVAAVAGFVPLNLISRTDFSAAVLMLLLA